MLPACALSCFNRTQSLKLCLDSANPWTVACQAPLSIRFSRQEYLSGLTFPPLGDLPSPGFQPGLLHWRWILYRWGYVYFNTIIIFQTNYKARQNHLLLNLHSENQPKAYNKLRAFIHKTAELQVCSVLTWDFSDFPILSSISYNSSTRAGSPLKTKSFTVAVWWGSLNLEDCWVK